MDGKWEGGKEGAGGTIEARKQVSSSGGKHSYPLQTREGCWHLPAGALVDPRTTHRQLCGGRKGGEK